MFVRSSPDRWAFPSPAAVLTTIILVCLACGGRTPLLDPPPSAPGLDPSPAAADTRQADSGVDRRGEPPGDAPRAIDARIDSVADVPARPSDLGVDSPSDARGSDTRPDVAVDSPRDGKGSGARDGGIDSRLDGTVDARRANDVGSRDGGREAGGDGGPTLKLIAGGPGGPGHQDGTLAMSKFNFPHGIASDNAGNLFVAEWQTSYGATLRKIDTATGTVTTLAGSIGRIGTEDGTGLAARFQDPVGIACDNDGNLFVTDFGAYTLRKIVVATGEVTTLAGSAGIMGGKDGTGTDARFYEPAGIAWDGAGNLFVADFRGHTIRKIVIATGVVTTLAGTLEVYGGKDGTGTDAQFSGPWGVVADRTGHLYVADGGGAVRKIVIASGVVTTLAGSSGVNGNKDGFGTSAQFNVPRGIALDDTGNLYVTESGGHVVRKVVIASGEVTTLAGTPGVDGSRDGKASEAQFSSPFGVAVGKARELFVLDTDNHIIRKLDPTTGVVSLYAGSLPQKGSADGNGPEARFSNPRGMASDDAGNLYVLDGSNYTLRKIVVATGVVTTVAGTAGEKGSVDGTGAAARFSALNEMVGDGAGNLFVSDGHSVRQVRLATGQVTTLAGASEDPGNLDGLGTAARFAGPRGLVYDGAGVLYVADLANNSIRKVIVASGEVSTLALSEDEGTRVDGGIKEVLRNPWGLASDGAGHLFVSEQNGRSVRQVVLATGKVTTLAGERGASLGHADGIGDVARFRIPLNMISDGAGGLLLADYGNHAVRKIDIATREVTTILGEPEQNGLALFPLRPILGGPGGLALGPAGQLFLTDRTQNVVLVAEF